MLMIFQCKSIKKNSKLGNFIEIVEIFSPVGTKTAKVQDQFECLYYLGCITLNAGSKWPPYANADSSKGYWELKAENGSSAKKVKKSPTTEEIKAAIAESIAELKNKKNVGTLQKPLERRK